VSGADGSKTGATTSSHVSETTTGSKPGAMTSAVDPAATTLAGRPAARNRAGKARATVRKKVGILRLLGTRAASPPPAPIESIFDPADDDTPLERASAALHVRQGNYPMALYLLNGAFSAHTARPAVSRLWLEALLGLASREGPEGLSTFTPAPSPPSSIRAQLLEAIDQVSQAATPLPELSAWQLRAARTLHYHHQLEAAERRYEALLARDPDSLAAADAAFGLGCLYLGRDPLPQAAAGIDALIRRPGLATAPRWPAAVSRLLELEAAAEVLGLRREPGGPALIELAAPLLVHGAPVADGGLHLRIDPARPFRLVDVGAALERNGRLEDAMALYRRIAVHTPELAGRQIALRRLARYHDDRLEPASAAEAYAQIEPASAAEAYAQIEPASAAEAYAQIEPASAAEAYAQIEPASAARAAEPREIDPTPPPTASSSLLRAAALRTAAHDPAGAGQVLERYALRATLEDAEPRLLEAARCYREAGAADDVVRVTSAWLEHFPEGDADRVLEALDLELGALEQLGRQDGARRLEAGLSARVDRLRSLPSLSADALYRYGRMRFSALERVAAEARATPLKGNAKAQKEALERRIAALKALREGLDELVLIGDPEWTTAALYTVGMAFLELADELVEAVPAGVDDGDRDIYIDVLHDSFIDPLETRAERYFLRNLEHASTFRIWNRWMVLSGRAMHRLRPDAFPSVQPERLAIELGDGQVEYREYPAMTGDIKVPSSPAR
jgi:hypothetical protein